MKKAFDQNVSRAKPRVKLGAFTPEGTATPEMRSEEEWVYEVAAQVAGHSRSEPESQGAHASVAEPTTARELLAPAERPSAEAEVLRGRTQREVEPEMSEPKSPRERVEATLRGAAPQPGRPTAAEAHRSVGGSPVGVPGGRVAETRSPAPVREPGGATLKAGPPATVSAPAGAPIARAPATVLPRAETMAPQPPAPGETEARRERLRERLRGVREHPRPEPLPTNVTAAGVMAVERIAELQEALNVLKAHNAALQHDLDVAKRTAERATEEARARVEEARRLATQMDERAGLLSELERELQALEGERDEALLAVQGARTQTAAQQAERERLQTLLKAKETELADSLAEEERLAGELENFRDDTLQLRRTVEALTAERDTLARQVTDLTTERAELLEARKALESVHRALTQAARR
jgi:hypothetical protein